jgi:hypothetical protein
VVLRIRRVLGDALEKSRDRAVVAQNAPAAEFVAHFVIFFGNAIFQFDRQLVSVGRQKFKNEYAGDFPVTIPQKNAFLNRPMNFGVALFAKIRHGDNFSDFDFKNL